MSQGILRLIHKAYIEGYDLISDTEESQILARIPAGNSSQIVDLFQTSLSDDFLSQDERRKLVTLGLTVSEMDAYDWDHAWTATQIRGLLKSKNNVDESDLQQAIKVLSGLDLEMVGLEQREDWAQKIAEQFFTKSKSNIFDPQFCLAVFFYNSLKIQRPIPAVFKDVILAGENSFAIAPATLVILKSQMRQVVAANRDPQRFVLARDIYEQDQSPENLYLLANTVWGETISAYIETMWGSLAPFAKRDELHKQIMILWSAGEAQTFTENLMQIIATENAALLQATLTNETQVFPEEVCTALFAKSESVDLDFKVLIYKKILVSASAGSELRLRTLKALSEEGIDFDDLLSALESGFDLAVAEVLAKKIVSQESSVAVRYLKSLTRGLKDSEFTIQDFMTLSPTEFRIKIRDMAQSESVEVQEAVSGFASLIVEGFPEQSEDDFFDELLSMVPAEFLFDSILKQTDAEKRETWIQIFETHFLSDVSKIAEGDLVLALQHKDWPVAKMAAQILATKNPKALEAELSQAPDAIHRFVILTALSKVLPEKYNLETITPGPIMPFGQMVSQRVNTELGDFVQTSFLDHMKTNAKPFVFQNDSGVVNIFVLDDVAVYRFQISSREITKQKIASVSSGSELASVAQGADGFFQMEVVNSSQTSLQVYQEFPGVWQKQTWNTEPYVSERKFVYERDYYQKVRVFKNQYVAVEKLSDRICDQTLTIVDVESKSHSTQFLNSMIWGSENLLNVGTIRSNLFLPEGHSEVRKVLDRSEFDTIEIFDDSHDWPDGRCNAWASYATVYKSLQEFQKNDVRSEVPLVESFQFLIREIQADGTTREVVLDNSVGEVQFLKTVSYSINGEQKTALVYLDSQAKQSDGSFAPGLVVATKNNSKWILETVISHDWLEELDGHVEDVSVTFNAKNKMVLVVRAEDNKLIQIQGMPQSWQTPQNIIYSNDTLAESDEAFSSPDVPYFFYPSKEDGYLKLARQHEGVWRSYALAKRFAYTQNNGVALDATYLQDGRILVAQTIKQEDGSYSLEVLVQQAPMFAAAQ